MEFIKQIVDFIIYFAKALKYLVDALKNPSPYTPKPTETSASITEEATEA